MSFAENLKRIRLEKGFYNLTKFASSIGLNPGTYYRYEHHGSLPSEETLLKIAMKLDVTLDSLFGLKSVSSVVQAVGTEVLVDEEQMKKEKAKSKALYLHLDFETLDSAQIPFSAVAFMDAKGISEDIVVSDGRICHRGKLADEFMVFFYKDSLKDVMTFYGSFVDGKMEPLEQHLQHCRDLVGFRIEYADHHEETYSVLWKDGKTDEINALMHVFDNTTGIYRGEGGIGIYVGEKNISDVMKGMV